MWTHGAHKGPWAAALHVCLASHPGCAALHGEENPNGTIRQGRRQERGESVARAEGGEASLGQKRQGRQSHQPCAGHRHRAFRSAPARRQGSEEEVVAQAQPTYAPKGCQSKPGVSARNLQKTNDRDTKQVSIFRVVRIHSYSTTLPNRIRRNSMKTNDRGLGYSTKNRAVIARLCFTDFRVSNFASLDQSVASHKSTGGII